MIPRDYLHIDENRRNCDYSEAQYRGVDPLPHSYLTFVSVLWHIVLIVLYQRFLIPRRPVSGHQNPFQLANKRGFGKSEGCTAINVSQFLLPNLMVIKYLGRD